MFHKKRKPLLSSKGFTLVELIVFITISSVFITALFLAFRSPLKEFEADINDVFRIGQNASEIFRSWLMTRNACVDSNGNDSCALPSNIYNFPTAGYSATCLDTDTNLLCQINFGNNYKYDIDASITEQNLAPPSLVTIPNWHLSVAVTVYHKTPSGTWDTFITHNMDGYIVKS